MCVSVIWLFHTLALIRRNASTQHECAHTQTCRPTHPFIQSSMHTPNNAYFQARGASTEEDNTHTHTPTPREALHRCCAREQSWAPPAWVLPLIPSQRPLLDPFPAKPSARLRQPGEWWIDSGGKSHTIPPFLPLSYSLWCGGVEEPLPLEAHLRWDIWNVAAQLLSKIRVAANGRSTTASFQRMPEPDCSCHILVFFNFCLCPFHLSGTK